MFCASSDHWEKIAAPPHCQSRIQFLKYIHDEYRWLCNLVASPMETGRVTLRQSARSSLCKDERPPPRPATPPPPPEGPCDGGKSIWIPADGGGCELIFLRPHSTINRGGERTASCPPAQIYFKSCTFHTLQFGFVSTRFRGFLFQRHSAARVNCACT